MSSGPLGPATDLLLDLRLELETLNDQIRLLREQQAPPPMVTVKPADVVLPPFPELPAAPQPLDLTPLLQSLQRLDNSASTATLEGLRKDFDDLATTLRHIVGSIPSVGSGSSYVITEPATNHQWPTVDAPLEYRWDYALYGSANKPVYVGQASPGTATSTQAWRIDKYTYSLGPDGSNYVPVRQQTQSGVAWDDRASLTW